MDAKPRRGAGARADFLAWNLMRHQAWKRSNPFQGRNFPQCENFVDCFFDVAQVRLTRSVTVASSSTTCTDDGLNTGRHHVAFAMAGFKKNRRSTSATNPMALQSRVIR